MHDRDENMYNFFIFIFNGQINYYILKTEL